MSAKHYPPTDKHGISNHALASGENLLRRLSESYAEHYQTVGAHDYPREWMQDHSDDRAALIRVRKMLLTLEEQA